MLASANCRSTRASALRTGSLMSIGCGSRTDWRANSLIWLMILLMRLTCPTIRSTLRYSCELGRQVPEALLGEEADGQEGLVQFVGDAGAQLPHGHQLAGLDQFAARPPQLAVALLQFPGVLLGLVAGFADRLHVLQDPPDHGVERLGQPADLVAAVSSASLRRVSLEAIPSVASTSYLMGG